MRVLLSNLSPHLENKTVQEVVAMTPELQAFAERDPGFRQFNNRYETVSADPETRREYAMWFEEALRQEGMLEWARQEGMEEGWQGGRQEGKLEGLEEGRIEAKQSLIHSAQIMKSEGIPLEIIRKAFPSLVDELEAL